MDLTPWKIEYAPGWDIHLQYFPTEIQMRIRKKCEQMKQPLQGRGLHGTRFQVEEVGEYRIAHSLDSINKIKEIHFVGNHKQYEKWYTQNIGFHDDDWSRALKPSSQGFDSHIIEILSPNIIKLQKLLRQ